MMSKRISLREIFRAWIITLLLVPFSACVTDSVENRSFKKVTYYNSSNQATVLITAYLAKPEGDGPFPAVILLHGCAGLGLDQGGNTFKSLRRYQDALSKAGYVSLIIDSWGSRGLSSADLMEKSCPGVNLNWKYGIRTGDLGGGIRYLKSLPYVGSQIGALGQSQGAETMLYAAGWRQSDVRKNLLDAAIALYPACVYRPLEVRIPLLILMGAEDNVTPASRCQIWIDKYQSEIEKRNDAEGRSIGTLPELIIYPGAHHSYDLPLGRKSNTPIGIIAPNRPASEDTMRRVIDFFDQNLKDVTGSG